MILSRTFKYLHSVLLLACFLAIPGLVAADDEGSIMYWAVCTSEKVMKDIEAGRDDQVSPEDFIREVKILLKRDLEELGINTDPESATLFKGSLSLCEEKNLLTFDQGIYQPN